MNSEIQILWKLLFLVCVIDLLICLHQLVIKCGAGVVEPALGAGVSLGSRWLGVVAVL